MTRKVCCRTQGEGEGVLYLLRRTILRTILRASLGIDGEAFYKFGQFSVNQYEE